MAHHPHVPVGREEGRFPVAMGTHGRTQIKSNNYQQGYGQKLHTLPSGVASFGVHLLGYLGRFTTLQRARHENQALRRTHFKQLHLTNVFFLNARSTHLAALKRIYSEPSFCTLSHRSTHTKQPEPLHLLPAFNTSSIQQPKHLPS